MQRHSIPDLTTARKDIHDQRSSASDLMDRCLSMAHSPRCENMLRLPMFEQARADAANPVNRSRPLGGLAVSVKDLFDIRGQVTTAGSRALAERTPATQDCPAVARLRAAGGAIIGRTNMTEFAFSGVGINPHFGTPANAASRDEPLIPGGSSSGAAVSVATGAAYIGLGSDTGGSIRIPAALNGIVGFKNTAALVPTCGAIPLSTTLDTVCAMTRSVPDAILAHEILAARRVVRSSAPLSAYRLAVARNTMHDALDATVSRAYQRSLAQLRANGARIEEIELPQLDELPALMTNGAFAAAESYAWHRQMIARDGALYDPRVLARIERGAAISAADYVDLIQARADWMTRVNAALRDFDALLSPTVPIVAPAIRLLAPGSERDGAFFAANALLLRNTNVVNLLDGCALSLPCHEPDELPVGLMVWHGAGRDDGVLNVALQIEQLLCAA